MKRLYNNFSKGLLAIVCSVFAFVCVISLIVCAFFQSWNLYSSNRDDFSDYVNRYAGTSYATLALSDYQGDFNKDKLSDMNCYYGIIQGKSSDDVDINNADVYLYKNFDVTKVPDNAYVGDYRISSDTDFVLSDKFLDLWGGNQVIDYSSEVYNTYSVKGIGYDPINNQAYVYSNGKFYLLKSDYYEYMKVTYPDEESKSWAVNSAVNTIYKKIWEANRPDAVDYYKPLEGENESDETTYVIESDEGDSEETTEEYMVDYLPAEQAVPNASVTDDSLLYIEDMAFEPLSKSFPDTSLDIISDEYEQESLLTDYVADLTPIHDTLVKINEEKASFDSLSTIGMYESNPDSVAYTFVCFPKDVFNGTNDFYAQAKWFIGFTQNMKYVFPIVTILSFVISILCYVLFMFAAGHKKDSAEISVNWLSKIWTDVVFWSFILIEYIISALVYSFTVYMRESKLSLGMTVAIYGLFAAVMMTVGLMWSANLAVNVKLHRFFKHTFAYQFIAWLKGKLAVLHQASIRIRKNIKWTRRIWIFFIVITIIEYFVIMISYSTREIAPFWAIEKLAFAIALYKLLYSYARIKEAATCLAAGDLSAQVELKGMPLFMAEHAIAMNQIQEGINVALEERTKSERMKTELITNVSHDIKTPLTSIINYVDLLNKEDVKNDKAKEYLKVLSRQAARLKKLIEDLIEASKASTGNIKFTMERINAGVLLNQSIGEFADRLEAGHITVVTDLPSEDTYLMADNRYLWRVFDNLMSNIVKYAQPDTRAYIDLKNIDGKNRFTFRNTSKNELNITADELMERFVRGDKSRYTDGNGLGLSIAKSLTESMGGKMKLEIDGDLFKAIVEFNELQAG